MIISVDAEKAFDKIQHPFMIKNSPESGHRGNILQHNKGPQLTIILIILINQKTFFQKSGTRQG